MKDGFTLIEVMAALLILAIVAGAVALSVAGPRRSAETEDVLGELIHADRLARHTARRHGRAVELVFDLAAGRVERRWIDGPDEESYRYELPKGFRFGELILADRRIASSSASVVCSRAGRTPTYALRIDAPGGRRRWVLFAGLSGEATEIADERQLEEILGLLTRARPDAD